jgi:hypothetical protein
MSLIIEILPWDVRPSEKALSGSVLSWALMPVNSATPIGRCGGGRLCAARPRNELGHRGFIAGFRPYLLSTRLLPGKVWHFAYSVPGVVCCVLPRRIFGSIWGAYATLLFSLPGRIIIIRR